MKTTLYKSSDRGAANYGWLQANYSFSFANYFNPQAIQFGALRVLNDDTIAPSMGFSTHPHDNMEIITIPLSGTLKHKDSMHNEWQEVKTGEVQVMSAGTGVYHSEMNASTQLPLSLFQIWILPNKQGVAPRYDQKEFKVEALQNQLQVLVSPIDEPQADGLKIHQNAYISRLVLEPNKAFNYQLNHSGNGVYLMLVNGQINISQQELTTRDAIGIEQIDSFDIATTTESDILILEVPMKV
jgi:quercetin 2,3-dioxygenase